MEEDDFAITERNDFFSPTLQTSLWKELNNGDSQPSCMSDHLFSGYVKTLSMELRCQYLSKLRLMNPSVDLPDPYKIVGWVKNMKKWPDLNSSHFHQYLLCKDSQTEGEDTACASLMGYNAFKLGNVLEVEYTSISISIIVTVCFLKAMVVSPYQGGRLEAHLAWVCLDKTNGTIEASHCTCLKRFEGVCRHIAGLLFKVEAAVSLGMNKEDTARSSVTNSSRKVTMKNKCNRSRLCVARVKDTYFTHQNSNKGLRQPLKDLKLRPLSKFEQKRALGKLWKIIPNALIFLKEESDTDTASEDEGDSERLSPSAHHPHTASQGFENERHMENLSPSAHHPHTASEGEEEKEQLSSPLHHKAFTSSDDELSSVISAFDFEGFDSDEEASGLGATTPQQWSGSDNTSAVVWEQQHLSSDDSEDG